MLLRVSKVLQAAAHHHQAQGGHEQPMFQDTYGSLPYFPHLSIVHGIVLSGPLLGEHASLHLL